LKNAGRGGKGKEALIPPIKKKKKKKEEAKPEKRATDVREKRGEGPLPFT